MQFDDNPGVSADKPVQVSVALYYALVVSATFLLISGVCFTLALGDFHIPTLWPPFRALAAILGPTGLIALGVLSLLATVLGVFVSLAESIRRLCNT